MISFYPLNKKNQITTFDIMVFLRQFATLLSAGIPIIKSLEILSQCQPKIACASLIHLIKKDILSGKNLFTCMSRHARYFDELTCHLISIGEHTGKLNFILNTIAMHHEKSHRLKLRLKQTLFYPILISIAALIITICMLLFIIPRFAELFEQVKTPLPFITVSLFYLSDTLRTHFWLFILLFCTILFFFWRFQYKYKLSYLTIVLDLPIIFQFIQKIDMLRLARYLALALSAGIPITTALSLTAKTCLHEKSRQEVLKLQQKINSGVSLHQAMHRSNFFPPLLIHMVQAGEESGMLEHMLEKFADFSNAEIEKFIQHLSQLLEPLIMLVLGVLIGGLVIGMYLPIFELGNVM